jgi:hypothetical protein
MSSQLKAKIEIIYEMCLFYKLQWRTSDSFINRTIQVWNQLPEDALGALSCKPSNFIKRVMK